MKNTKNKSQPTQQRVPTALDNVTTDNTHNSLKLVIDHADDTTSVDFQVIGACWGRTGTHSLKNALEILGYKCYHMKEVISHGENHTRFWQRAAQKSQAIKADEIDFNEVFMHDHSNKVKNCASGDSNNSSKKNFTASCDFPSAAFWKEQVKQYPKAKVILGLRDPEKWYQSCMDTIFRVIPDHPNCSLGTKISHWLGLPAKGMGDMVVEVISKRCFGQDFSRKIVINSYVQYCEQVKRDCPAHQLLVHEPKDGWEPLCKFLGKPVPNVPYPHVNDTKEFQRIVRLTQVIGYFTLVFTLGLPLLFLPTYK
jgi:hypothetical protein